MKEGGVSMVKSKKFAIRIVELYKHLCLDKKEFVMSKQILRAGTSIGANLAEAEYAVSKKEFVAKKFIALKECSESKYWLDLLHYTGFISETEFTGLCSDCEELLKIITAAIKTTRNKEEYHT